MLGTKIKELRLQKKMTQEELGKYCGVTRSTVANWEAGKRNVDLATCKKIAEYFDVTVNYLTENESKVNKDFVHGAKAYFMSEDIKQPEKDKIIQQVMDYYFKSKGVHKNDKGRSTEHN